MVERSEHQILHGVRNSFKPNLSWHLLVPGQEWKHQKNV